MPTLILKPILLLALPILVFVSGAWTMGRLVGLDYATHQLREKANDEDRKPLDQRIAGYTLAGVDRHWGALDPQARRIEQHFLELDLVFPFLYGAAIAGALLLAWVDLGRPFHPAWLFSPVVITVLADWTENFVQLSQLQRYVEKGRTGLETGWIQTASAATVVKLVFFSGASLLLLSLAIWMIVRVIHPPS